MTDHWLGQIITNTGCYWCGVTSVLRVTTMTDLVLRVISITYYFCVAWHLIITDSVWGVTTITDLSWRLTTINNLCVEWQLNSYSNIATLSYILDSRLSWKSGKFHLERWSHEIVKFPERTSHSPNNHMNSLFEYTLLWFLCVFFTQNSFLDQKSLWA